MSKHTISNANINKWQRERPLERGKRRGSSSKWANEKSANDEKCVQLFVCAFLAVQFYCGQSILIAVLWTHRADLETYREIKKKEYSWNIQGGGDRTDRKLIVISSSSSSSCRSFLTVVIEKSLLFLFICLSTLPPGKWEQKSFGICRCSRCNCTFDKELHCSLILSHTQSCLPAN